MRALLLLTLLSLTACGDSRGIAMETQCLDKPMCGITNAQAYDACLQRNPNYFGSPAWYYWVDQCKLKWGIRTTGYPSYNSQPSSAH
jgi:hypothetical protein